MACNGTFGSVTSQTYIGTGTSSTTFSSQITGLSAGTTYYYCAVTQNSEGTVYGSVLSFTTASQPVLTTLAAASVGPSYAYLEGSGVPDGADTTAWFMYSTTNPGTCNNSFGTRVPASGSTDLGSGSSAVTYNDYVSGLTPNTT
jgi:hypothetical protein